MTTCETERTNSDTVLYGVDLGYVCDERISVRYQYVPGTTVQYMRFVPAASLRDCTFSFRREAAKDWKSNHDMRRHAPVYANAA